MKQINRDVDPSVVEVVRNYLISAAEEMRATLIRTACNPVIYEVLDFGISIYDRNLDLIAEGPGLTSFLGANDYSIVKLVEYLGEESFEDGDVVISNYPYWNAAHSYDATLTAPVFDNEHELFGYLLVRAHWMDLGAKDPGYVLDSTDMHQEGLIFPGTKLVKNRVIDKELIELIRFNSRMPDVVIGDFNAMVSSLRTGERRIKEILSKFGSHIIDKAIKQILDSGEKATNKALQDLPKGTWTASDIIDDDADVRETLSALMEASGFEPVAFQDSDGFKAAGSPQDFDLALIDLRLKGESGLTLAIHIRETSELPIVMLTGVGDEIDKIIA